MSFHIIILKLGYSYHLIQQPDVFLGGIDVPKVRI